MTARIFLVLCSVTLLFAEIAWAEPVDKRFEHSFDVSPGATLHLQHGDGDVLIETWENDQVQVDVRYHFEIKGWTIGGNEKDFEVKFDQRGEHVYVVEDIAGGGHSIGVHARMRKEYSYTIKLPAYCVLDLEGDDGSVQISDVASSLELKSDDGDIELFQCQFERAVLAVEDGDVSVKSCRGNFDVEADDSNIDFEDCEIAEFRLEIEDGDADLDFIAVADIDWRMIADDGDIHLDISGEPSADIHLESDGGDMRADLPGLQELEKRRHSLSGVVGDGSGRIRIRTEDGDIRVRELSMGG